MSKWITLRLCAEEKILLESLAKGHLMTLSAYIKKKLFDDNSECGERRKVYTCPSGDKLNYIQLALAKQNQELLLHVLKKEYGEHYKEIFNQSFDITEEKLASQYNYKKIDTGSNE